MALELVKDRGKINTRLCREPRRSEVVAGGLRGAPEGTGQGVRVWGTRTCMDQRKQNPIYWLVAASVRLDEVAIND